MNKPTSPVRSQSESSREFAADSSELAEVELETISGGLLEMNQSFNLQYLALQQKMTQKNRKFSTLSNVLPVKHDVGDSPMAGLK